MASLFNKITRLASSPQGRRAVEQAKQFATDPKHRQQAKGAVEKVRKQLSDRRHRH